MRRYHGVALAMLLAGCSSEPSGQVVATVNGEEISRAELNNALAKSGASLPADPAARQNAMLDKLINRRVLVQSAKQRNIDKSQQYLLASREADDQLLISLLSNRVVADLRTPYFKDVDAYIAANPTQFGGRTILLVDQIRFPDNAFPEARLRNAASLADVGGLLDAAKVRYQRGKATMDSATIPSQGYAQLQALPPAQPFVVHQNGLTIVSSIVGRQAAPVEGEEAKKLAFQLIQQNAANAALVKQMEALRQRAEIKYQPGFGPPKPAPGAAKK